MPVSKDWLKHRFFLLQVSNFLCTSFISHPNSSEVSPLPVAHSSSVPAWLIQLSEQPGRPTVVWHITCSCIMLRFPFIISCLVYHVSCHEYFPGKCPTFTPMDGFDWDQVGRPIMETSNVAFSLVFKRDLVCDTEVCYTVFMFYLWVQNRWSGFQILWTGLSSKFLCFVTLSCNYRNPFQVRQLPYSERVGLDHEYM